ncbi:MAG: hypothetical protein H0U74_10930 [Bradymonadaceae bacterium]|nr:hypothetical protein [Lujinxingiaceae bacterium]
MNTRLSYRRLANPWMLQFAASAALAIFMLAMVGCESSPSHVALAQAPVMESQARQEVEAAHQLERYGIDAHESEQRVNSPGAPTRVQPVVDSQPQKARPIVSAFQRLITNIVGKFEPEPKPACKLDVNF